MDEYSLSGALEGGQLTADYTLKMNTLIDLAQNEITDHVGIYATQVITVGVTTPVLVQNGYDFYDLNPDIKDFRYVKVSDWPNPFNDYEVENGQFKINSAYTGNYGNNGAVFTLHYYKYPVPIDDNTPDSFILEVDRWTQQAIPYYVAGMCGSSSSEDLQLSDKLMAIWATKLNAMTKREIRYPRRSREVVWW